MTTRVEEKHLYLVKETNFRMLTEAEAAHLALMEEVEVWNVSEELGMGPELVTVEDQCYIVS